VAARQDRWSCFRPLPACGFEVKRRDACDAPSDDLLNSIEMRLPWSALAPYWAAAERHGITIRLDDDARELALRGLGEHLVECANGSDDEARVMTAMMSDESLTFYCVMVAESVISHVVSRGPEWPLSRLWLAD
jgi:hypothetical protein